MCYDLVELFLPFIFSGRKPKPFAIIQVPSACKGKFTDILNLNRHFLSFSLTPPLSPSLFLSLSLPLSHPPLFHLSSSLSQKKGAQFLPFVSGMKPSPLLLHNDPLIFESNVYTVIFPQDLCRKTVRFVPSNTLRCDKL